MTRDVSEDVSHSTEQDALFEMANLFPRDTGLPMTVWLSPRGNARHDVRVKVCLAYGDRMDASNTAVVAVRPKPELLHGTLRARDEQAVLAWVALNTDIIVGYWDGRISTVELALGLKKITATGD